MRYRIDAAVLQLLALLALPGIAAAQATPTTQAPCSSCGVIVSIGMSVREEHWTPLGVVSPGTSLTAGGGSEGRTAVAFGPEGSRGVVMIGAAGGAMYAKRPNAYQRPRWDVTIKMESGETRVVSQSYEPLLREGDRVRVMGTQLELVDS
jgi:outer membrane lipoprotein SlyB